MSLSELKVPMSTSGNPFRKLLAVGLLFTDAKESFEAAFVWSEQANTLATIQPRQLREDDIQSIVAFLQALSGEPTSSMDF